MNTIIAVKGTANIGKTSAILAVFDKLVKCEGVNPVEVEKNGEVKAVLTYTQKQQDQSKTILIGIDSQGDPHSRQGESLHSFADQKCHLIICASRTKSETRSNIENLSNNPEHDEYKIIWTSNLSARNIEQDKRADLYKKLNDTFADAIVSLIDQLYFND
jgi:hypothetical protein